MGLLHSDIQNLKQRAEDLADDLNALEALLGVDVPSSLNKIRYIAEKVLQGLCQSRAISWGQTEPTLERMIGPLVAAGCIPKNVAIHVRTIQMNTSPGSHYQESALSESHVIIAQHALVEFLEWHCQQSEGGIGTSPPKRPAGKSQSAVWRRLWAGTIVLSCLGVGVLVVVLMPRPDKNRADLLDAQICLADAQEAFTAQNYGGCLEKLNAYPWPTPPTQTVHAEAQLLRKRADFRQRGDPFRGEIARLLKTLPGPAWQSAVRDVSAFFEEHVAAPHAEDEALYDSLKESAELLEGKYGLAMTAWSELPSLRAKVQKLHELVRQHPKAKLHREASDTLRQWLEAGVPDKTPPAADPDIRQAVSSNGAIYVGLFELNGDYYKFWKTKAEQRANPSGYRTIVPDSLTQQPGPLTPVKVVTSYNKYHLSLLRDVASRQAWVAFEKCCAGLQADLDEFVNRGAMRAR